MKGSFLWSSSGVVMVGVMRELRSLTVAVLLREVFGTEPVWWVKSAFCFAMAAAASGNMELISAGSNPERRLVLGEGGGRPKPTELRELSTASFPMAQLSRLDIASASAPVSGRMRQVFE